MSVRHALLALLEQGPMYGYQLRTEFEGRTGSTWPLNIGQVYTTLARLERDGMIEAASDEEVGEEGKRRYAITTDGRVEVATWFDEPVGRGEPPRDELAIKLAIAVTIPGVDVASLVQRQRTATMNALHDYTRLKRGAATEEPADLAWSLVLDSLIFTAEAEIRWLDHCEARLARRSSAPTRSTVAEEAAR
ncbi:PadR family transcriptional regulator [Nocardioides jiangxiensis]|uniref:PadR family transcriptional regulator n=1 Tax=Nocardioides jiangxiensis TaxID=3064524 RepID=A0ABT9AZT3_9ACTN|nr:PadR family transcriptional regulator [Nocardioides sp. WY-20]MDO7868059.1 PadR family transcriptional regulator [Nocardioides sp. WY-20]